ncbi:Mu transposase C-terminal domain-containing protein [Proteinivorax tanatarense]|uniref:Mu transposase C-terminal domain-containing protein n=1 Tax=Proteinivorax tanatarense TaxID=1260629 RepID=A0AAU7VM10_9FIRM
MLVTVNTLVSWYVKDEKKTERILWLDRKTDVAFVIDINENKLPTLKILSEIEKEVESGSASVEVNDKWQKNITENKLQKNHKEKRDRRWTIIEKIATKEPDIYMKEKRSMLLKEAAKAHNVPEGSIARILKLFWRGGKTKNALTPDYQKAGGRGKEKSAGGIKRGRPRKQGEIFGEGVNIDERIKEIFQAAVNKYYYSYNQNTLRFTYEMMLKEYFSDKATTDTGAKIPVIKSSSEIPTYNQFRYWYQKQRDFKKEVRLRRGAKKYEQQNRSVLGNSTSEALGPGSIYQIDATIGDVYLVSQFNRNWVIGRPVIYGIIDVFSRLVVGIYVGLEGPSWTGAMMALANAAMDKVQFCKKYGIEITEKQWPAQHLPDAILGDRGELEGKNVENLISSLGVKIQNTPPYRADWKGIIEQNFKTTNQRVKPFTPGAVNVDFNERGDKDYRLDAKLTLKEFTQIIIRSVLFHNNYNILKNYNREDMMIEDDVELLPLSLWKWGIANRSGKLKSVDADIIKLSLLPNATAAVTSRGIKFKKMYYASNLTIQENWFEKARNKGYWKVDVSYDPRNMKYLYVHAGGHGEFEKCQMLDYQESYFDKFFEEIEFLQEKEKNDIKKMEEQELQQKVEMMTEVEQIVKKAEIEFEKELEHVSKSQKIRGIRENRKLEKEYNRGDEAFELQKTPKRDAELIKLKGQKPHENQDEMDLLRKKQREAFFTDD